MNSESDKIHSRIILNIIGRPSNNILLIISIFILFSTGITLFFANMMPLFALIGFIFFATIFYNFDLMFYGFLYALPILSQFGGEHAVILIRLYGFLLIGIWLLRIMLHEKKINLPPKEINIFFIALGILIILSSASNLDRVDFNATIRILAFCILFYVFYDWSYHKDWRTIMWTILFPLSISAVFLVVKLIENPSSAGIIKLTFMRYSTFIENAPNVLGAYFCMAIPPAFTLGVLSHQKYLKYFSILSLPFSLLALFISNSRAAYLGVTISLFILALIFNKTRKIAIALTVAGTIIVIAIPSLRQMGSFVLRLNVDPTSRRTVVWQSSINSITTRPLWGSGVGNEAKDISDGLALASYKHEFGDAVGAHDLFLNKAVEFGLMGVILIIYLNYCLAKIIIRNFQIKLNSDKLILNYLAMGVVIALLMRSLFEHSVWISGTGMFPEFYSWMIVAWPMKIYQQS